MGIYISAAAVRRYTTQDAPPDDVQCAITHDLVQNPVQNPQTPQHVFSRRALCTWLNQAGTDPITRQPLNLAEALPNPAAKARVNSLLRWGAREHRQRALAPGISPQQAAEHHAQADTLLAKKAAWKWMERLRDPAPPAALPRAPRQLRVALGPHGVVFVGPPEDAPPTSLLRRAYRALRDSFDRAAGRLVRFP